MQQVLRFLADENGPTAVEYAIMLGLIIIVCLSTIASLGDIVMDSFSATGDALDSLQPTAASGS